MPRSFALNASTSFEAIEVTLLTLVELDDLARITGFIRIGRGGDVGLSGVPILVIGALHGAPLVPLRAHVLPHGPKAAWMSWLFKRPASMAVQYEARIEQIELVHAGIARLIERVPGPWEVVFSLPAPDRPVGLIRRVD
ncbi:MAG: hypothetical protein ACRDGI_07445 [Candidatus Limnocylindrales bacterium]